MGEGEFNVLRECGGVAAPNTNGARWGGGSCGRETLRIKDMGNESYRRTERRGGKSPAHNMNNCSHGQKKVVALDRQNRDAFD